MCTNQVTLKLAPKPYTSGDNPGSFTQYYYHYLFCNINGPARQIVMHFDSQLPGILYPHSFLHNKCSLLRRRLESSELVALQPLYANISTKSKALGTGVEASGLFHADFNSTSWDKGKQNTGRR